MQRIIILFYLFLFSLGIQGATPEEIRSRINQLEESTEKVDSLIYYSRDLTQNYPRDAVDLAKDAVNASKRLKPVSTSRTYTVRSFSNLAQVYMNQRKYNYGVASLQEAIKRRKSWFPSGNQNLALLAEDYRLMGVCYDNLNKFDLSGKYFKEAINYAGKARSRDRLIASYNSYGESQIKMEAYQGAVKSFQSALGLTNENSDHRRYRTIKKNLDTALQLSEEYFEKQRLLSENKAYELKNQEFSSELDSFTSELDSFSSQLTVIRDSLAVVKEDKQIVIQEKQLLEMAKREQDLELEKVQAQNEVLDERNQKNIIIGIAIGAFLLTIILALYNRARLRRKHNIELKGERDRTKLVINNILPRSIAEDMIRGIKQPARDYPRASILFTDFKNFSGNTEHMAPKDLVNELEALFRIFDKIMIKYEMRKIKTIGDAYMAASIVPDDQDEQGKKLRSRKDTDHAIDAVAAALEMIKETKRFSRKSTRAGGPPWEVRIGIHSGPVSAGVIGDWQFAFDVWGKNVNLASRIESAGEANRLNISGETYELVKNLVDAEHRGKISVKNMGEVDMYFVNDLKAKRKEGYQLKGKNLDFWNQMKKSSKVKS